MRKLMWFTIGFGGACVLCTLFLWNHALLPYIIAVTILCAGLCTLSRKWDFFRIAETVCIGLIVGILWFQLYGAVYIRPITELDGKICSLSISATGYSEQGPYRTSVEGSAQIAGKPYHLRVFLKENREVTPGDVLEGDFQIRLTTPEGERDSAYYQGNGVFLVATQKGELELIHPQTLPVWSLPALIAKQAKMILQTCFPSDTASFAKALLLGDTADLSYEDDTALKISGIRHVVAVSGLHVSFLVAVILFLCRKRRFLTFVAAVPVLFLFAAVTGFSPSVSRACLMSLLMLLGTSIREEYDGLTGLSFACLIMMAANPYIISSVSFQLSVSSVLGILLFASKIYQWFTGKFSGVKPTSRRGSVIRWAAGSLSVSTSAMIVTTPISAYYFGAVSLVGILTNLLTIWAVGILFCGLVAVCLTGFMLVPAGAALARMLSWLIRYVLYVSKFMASIPFAAVYMQSGYMVIWLYIAYALLLAFLIFRWWGKTFFAVGLGALIIAILLSVFLPKLDAFRLTVMNVGEGQCILLQSGGKSLLVDCGGDSDTGASDYAAQTLLSQGIRQLDAIALTHYDSDHTGGVSYLLTRIGADVIYLPEMGDDTFADHLHGMNSILISQNMQLPFGNGVLTFCAPDHQKSDNENCMCILFESEKCDILITGDRGHSGEKRLMDSIDLPDVDVLIAGHHGSKTSSSYELLQTVTPEVVIISVGEGNSYGHPALEVLERLEEFNCTVFRTDQHGTILVRR